QPAQEQPSSSSSSSPSPAPSVSPGSIGAPSGDAAALAQAYANQYADGRYRDRVARYNAQAAAVQRPGIGSEIASLGMNYVGRLHYVVAGESLSSGADCAGFVCALYRCFGVDLERNLELFNMLGVPVTPDPSCMQPGDIVLYYAGGGIGHVALYVGNGIIVNESGCYGNGCVNDCCTRAFNYRSIASVRRVFCY
ncbi:MAG: C40 family peptidase, partial [Lachnospiraceae bacterium]|nr:C40 family peptidase [Candidatus Equihabitans merdae]